MAFSIGLILNLDNSFFFQRLYIWHSASKSEEKVGIQSESVAEISNFPHIDIFQIVHCYKYSRARL